MWLEANKPVLAEQLKALPWIADGVDGSERDAAELLIAVATWQPDVFDALLQKPWVMDSVTEHETTAMEWILWITGLDVTLAERMLAKSWMQDGVTRDEATVIEQLYWITGLDVTLAERVLAKSWMQDGITRDEATVIEQLRRIIRAEDGSLQSRLVRQAIKILDMPFLDTIESPDAPAMRSLARFRNGGAAEFLELMTHPTLSDGIDDEEAKIVVLLGETNDYQPDLVPVLLDGTSVFKEERTITLPHSGDVLLAIIRFSTNHSNSNMDYLEHAVRHHEGFMGEPLPTNYVALYFVDYVDVGHHAGTHMASNPANDSVIANPGLPAHEVAHYYWTHSQVWISEGGAQMLFILSENARVGRPLVHIRGPCMSSDAIGALDSAVGPGDPQFSCFYSLGERLFLDLYRALGEEAFRQAFRSLYLKRLHDDPADDCEGTTLGICHVEAAFKNGASGDAAARVDAVIGHWYYGRTATHEGDRAELVALYRAAGGANWTDNTNWLSDAHIKEWYGVTTDADGRVIHLNLAGNGLSGELPPGLGNLANLRNLWLGDNRLRGSIPPELGSLTNLNWLVLSDNDLTGTIPSSLGNLTNLTLLRLNDNDLTGTIPSSLVSLTNLAVLYLDDNDLTGTIPSSLGNLTSLVFLYLDGNELTGTIPSSLDNLPELRFLRLARDNRFTGCVPVALTNVAYNDLAALGLPSC